MPRGVSGHPRQWCDATRCSRRTTDQRIGVATEGEYLVAENNLPMVDGAELVPGVETVQDGIVSVFVVDAGPGKVVLVDAGKNEPSGARSRPRSSSDPAGSAAGGTAKHPTTARAMSDPTRLRQSFVMWR